MFRSQLVTYRLKALGERELFIKIKCFTISIIMCHNFVQFVTKWRSYWDFWLQFFGKDMPSLFTLRFVKFSNTLFSSCKIMVRDENIYCKHCFTWTLKILEFRIHQWRKGWNFKNSYFGMVIYNSKITGNKARNG